MMVDVNSEIAQRLRELAAQLEEYEEERMDLNRRSREAQNEGYKLLEASGITTATYRYCGDDELSRLIFRWWL